jgi:hypothetical protein
MGTDGSGDLAGAVTIDYRGTAHALGRTADSYAIWRLSGGAPLRTFPLTDQGWVEAWLAYRELEPGADAQAPGGSDAWSASVGAQSGGSATSYIAYRGTRYGLGRSGDQYVIWDLSAGSGLGVFPLTDSGWGSAWSQYQQLESAVAFVPTRMWKRGHPIPLREMRVGQILDGAFKLYRLYFGTVLAVVGLVVVLYEGLILALTLSTGERLVLPGVPGQSFEVFAAAPWVGWVDLGLQIIITPFITGAVVRVVADAYLTGRPSVTGAYRAALPRIHSILWLTLLIGIPILLMFSPAILVVIAAVFQQEPGLIGLAFLLGLLGAVPAIFLAIRWLFATSALMIEGVRGIQAMRRSWNLCRRMGWKVLGTVVLAILILIAVSLVAGLLAAALFFFTQADALSRGDLSITPTFLIVSTAIEAVFDVLTRPFLTLVIVLLYFDIRVRKEGLDLEVMSQQIGLPPAAGA